MVEERPGKRTPATSPGVEKVFASAAAAAKALPKEQAAAIAAQEKALDKVQAQLADFRRGPG